MSDLEISIGLQVVRADDPDPDACAPDYPFEGVVVAFEEARFGAAVRVVHGDYEELIGLDHFWTVYRIA